MHACMPRAMKFRVNLREVSNVVFTCPVTCLSKHLRNFLRWPKFSSAQSHSILIRNRKNTRHSKCLICHSKWHLFVIKELFLWFYSCDVSSFLNLTSQNAYNRSAINTTHKILALDARFRFGISQSSYLKTSRPRLWYQM
jgi:hypothetical protein